jgi:hypothetical protein
LLENHTSVETQDGKDQLECGEKAFHGAGSIIIIVVFMFPGTAFTVLVFSGFVFAELDGRTEQGDSHRCVGGIMIGEQAADPCGGGGCEG